MSTVSKRKFCLLGEGAVGKTSLIRRFVTDQFDDRYITTIGTKVTKKSMDMPPGSGADRVEMMIWDIMGQQGYRTMLQESYFSGAAGALAICDVTRKDTLESIDGWISGIRGVCGEIPVVVLGNKADLKDQMQITSEEIRDKAASFKSTGHLTSAKTGENVEEAFLELVNMALKHNGLQ